MPELPEVETVVRQLAGTLPGHVIRELEVIHADLLREPVDVFRRALLGSTIEGVKRRGKKILLALSDRSLLVVNLGMTGQLLFDSPHRKSRSASSEGMPSHLALIFTLNPPSRLFYADTRRFGCFRRFTSAEWEEESARLGPEPLDMNLTPEGLHQRMERSGSPIRSWLLDQTRIAGIGNIYASEALFRAGIHPERRARSLSSAESANLLQALRDVLSHAIRAQGTTLRDYRTASGDQGGFGPFLLAYGKEGVPCSACNTPLQRIVFAGRSAFFCPSCQPRA